MLHNETSSVVINNGHYSEFLKLVRGCHQGDQVSSYIFILCFIKLIKKDAEIKGMKVEAVICKIGRVQIITFSFWVALEARIDE